MFVGCCCPNGQRTVAFARSQTGSGCFGLGVIWVLRFSIPGLRAPAPRQGCVRTHPWTPPPRALPLDPTGAQLAPGPPHTGALRFVLRCSPFWIAGFVLA